MRPQAAISPLQTQHIMLGALGAGAGLAMWLIVDVLPDALNNPHLLLWLASSALGFFLLIFAFLAQLSWRDAVLAAGLLALFDAALLFWASLRFAEFDNLFEESFSLIAWGLVLFIGAPFAVAVLRGKSKDYAFLFETAWAIVVRYAAAWLFVGLFWAVLHLSNALLKVIDVRLIQALIDFDPVPYVLTGATLGAALSVAQDLKAYISPYLPLRMLRLLVPMVLLVLAIFLAALPVRGLSQLFGDFSAAGILMAVVITGITLVSSALDKTDADGVQSSWMTWATRALAALLPFLAVLALWALWLRVSEYGWTPQRLAASLAALLVTAYAVLYGLAILGRDTWRTMIRQANVAMAVTVFGLATLWMTPILNAQRYSVQTQLNRYLSGQLPAHLFPSWEISHLWGHSGRAAVAHLNGLDHDTHADIQTLLKRAQNQSRWAFAQDRDAATVASLTEQYVHLIKPWPEDLLLTDAQFGNLPRKIAEDWAVQCSEDAARPCVVVMGPMGAQGAETALFFVPHADSGAVAFHLQSIEGAFRFPRRLRVNGEGTDLDENAFRQLISGGHRIGPATQQSLWLGDLELTTNN